MNKFLLTTAISGAVLVILASLRLPFNISIMYLFMALAFTVSSIMMDVNLIEDPDKAKAGITKSRSDFLYKTEGAKKRASEDFYMSAKRTYPVFTSIGTVIYLGLVISSLIRKANTGIAVFTFTFILGILLFITIIILIIMGINKKERIFASENIRKYAYIYINMLISLLLVAR